MSTICVLSRVKKDALLYRDPVMGKVKAKTVQGDLE